MTGRAGKGLPAVDGQEFWQELAVGSVNHLSQKELAARWRISPRTLERWRAARTGPPWLRIGTKRIAYRLADVLAFEQARIEGQERDDA